MTIVYCDWETGDDTNGTGTWDHPYKTITKATTGRTGGDEVRVAKSPEPTALTGTLSFTNNSTAVTGSGTAFTTELAIGDFVKGGDGYWWEVVTITSNTAATLYKKYSGTTQSGVSSQRLGVTDTAAASSSTIVQEVKSSGTSSANLKISGGWDLTTETQTGQTFFRQIHGTFNNRYGYGLYFNTKTYTEISHLNFLRYNYGIYYNSSSNNNTITGSPVCNSNGSYGIYYGSNNNTITGSPVCNSNGSYGIYYNGSNNNVIIGSPICNSNGSYGIYYSSSSNNNTITGSPICNSNSSTGIYYGGSYGSNNNVIYGTLTTSGNTTADIYNNKGINYILKASIAESTKVTGFTDYANSRLSIGDMGGQSYIYTDGGTIVTQAATAGGTGKEWKFSITSANRGANYPLNQEIARFLVAANKQVTVKLYFKKSNASAIAGALVVRGGQIAGVGSDVKVECPSDTNRNQVTLTFTPTEAGVVAIEVWAWYVSSTTDTVIVDDIDITQAD